MTRFNKIQTELTPEFINNLDKGIIAELEEILGSVLFINNLTNPNRKKVKDSPHDEEGKVIVDITNPHILEDMDYFRQPAIHFQKHNTYNFLAPNSSPNSDYFQFWKEETRRCREGLIRKYDGEWIPGSFYYYLNYSPILKSKEIKGTKAGDRFLGPPDMYDGDYLFYHYVDQARHGGEHAGLLKKRGAGFSYKMGADLGRILKVGYTTNTRERVVAFAIASETEYLMKDGILNKFTSNVSWTDHHTPWPRLKLSESKANMTWKMGYKTREGQIEGTENEIIGVTTKGDPDKAHPYSQKVITPNGTKYWKDITVGDKLFDQRDGETMVTEVQEFGERDVYSIKFNNGEKVQASANHEWEIVRWHDKNNKRVEFSERYETLDLIKLLKQSSIKTNSLKIAIRKNPVDFPVQSVPMDAYTLGLMIGDGSMCKSSNNQSLITMKHLDLQNISKYFPYKYKHSNYGGDIRNVIFVPNGRKIYKALNLYDKRAHNKFIPDVYKYNSVDVRLGMVNGLLDSDGTVSRDFGVILYCTKSKQLADDFLWVIKSLGINSKRYPKIVNGQTYYSCFVYCDSTERRLFNLFRKKELIKAKKNNKYAKNKRNFITIESIEYSHREQVKCVTVDAENSMYLIGNFVPTLNSRGKRGPMYWEEWGKFPNLLKSWEVARQSVQEGGVTFFTMIGGGTGGTSGANFQGAEELFYNCLGYNIRGIPNVFDKNTKGDSKCGFFWGAYLNRLRYYDKNGNSNIIGALVEILQTRYKIRANSTDPNTLVQNKAEMPITPQEAIMRREGSIFPIVDLKDHLAQISPNIQRFISPHYVGHLKYGMNGKVEWDKLQLHPVIRDYPLKRDVLDIYGCVEIYQMPKRKQDGTIPWGRYIAGIDSIDYDISTYAHSLGSVFIFDVLLDRIVAEYTGRPPRASEFYEQVLRLLKFYNAEANYENNLKGLFPYFERKRAMRYLCDTPQILKDMELVKGALYGNRAVGTHASKTVNAWGRKLQADWMISDAYDIDNIDEFDEEGNLIEQAKILNLQKIRSVAYLKETIAWNPDDNYDRISAMGMLMILREDKLKFEHKQLQEDHEQLLKDPWFNRFGGFTTINKKIRYNKKKYNMKF